MIDVLILSTDRFVWHAFDSTSEDSKPVKFVDQISSSQLVSISKSKNQFPKEPYLRSLLHSP